MATGSVLGICRPRVLAVRVAIAAAATRNRLQASSAHLNPDVSAAGCEACAASRCWVRLVAIAERIARPSAPPRVDGALISAAASPARSWALRRWPRSGHRRTPRRPQYHHPGSDVVGAATFAPVGW